MPSNEDPLSAAHSGVALVGELIKIAGSDPNVKDAAGNLGKAALTISKTINNALLPLAAVNFAFDKARIYFEGKFQEDLAERASKIPAEKIQEPKASIAGPALQALAFTHEEQSLKDMFLGLLTTAMDSRKAELAHPAFVEIIKQLDAAEAPQLMHLLNAEGFVAVATIEKGSPNNAKEQICRNLVNTYDKASREPVPAPRFPAMLDNWVRLGIAEVHYDAQIASESAYDWVETRPEYIKIKAEQETAENPITYKKGYIRLSSLGEEFAKAIQSKALDG